MSLDSPDDLRRIEALIPERLAYWCELIEMPAGAIAALQDMAAKVNTDSELSSVFASFHKNTAIKGNWHRDWSPLPLDPVVEERCGDLTSLFYLLAYLSALPYVWEQYQLLGLGLDVFKSTMLDFQFYAQDYFDKNGRWGYGSFGWIWRHVSVELFRFGRLQFMLLPFPGGVTAFRRVGGSDTDVMLLADPNMPLRKDGYAWGAGRSPGTEIPEETEETWRPCFEASPDGWRGHAVSPFGWVQKDPVWLPRGEWEIILEPGDTVLDLHIPRKDVLNDQTCSESYAQALEFFARVFPDRPHRALFCHTWIFSPQLQRFLPPTSNLVKFQREFTLYPVPGTVAYMSSFVFGGREDFMATPRDTELRRAALEWLETGGEIFDLAGLMFHKPKEWGSQPYMESSSSPSLQY